MKKIKLAILCGGKSAEHEVSLISAYYINKAIDKDKYEISIIGIDKDGYWYLLENENFLINYTDSREVHLNIKGRPLSIRLGDGIFFKDDKTPVKYDVVFPILHGPNGEDGTIQGLLNLLGIPFVGSNVLGSALAMDKDISKRLFRDANLPIVEFLSFKKNEKLDFLKVKEKLGLPLFIKPANMGSSIGISKIFSEKKFFSAIDLAFKYDNKVLVEKFYEVREIECAVLGNEHPIISLPGEIILNKRFYSYAVKYIDSKNTKFKIPVDLPKKKITECLNLAVKAYEVLCCSGLARIDFFLTKDEKFFINEINTLPGFTSISMYTKLWQASGIKYSELIDCLIMLAINKFSK